jgi:hypothetical protein
LLQNRLALAGSKRNHFGYIFWRRNISRGNDKLFCFFCNFDRKFLIGALDAIANSDGDSHINIQISNTNLLKDQPIGTVVGILSATDIDTAADALTFT